MLSSSSKLLPSRCSRVFLVFLQSTSEEISENMYKSRLQDTKSSQFNQINTKIYARKTIPVS